MSKKERAPRILTCAKTGKTWEYRGFGRPPKYHPDVAAEVRAEQRRGRAKAKRATAKAGFKIAA